jgi:hypothetical protein
LEKPNKNGENKIKPTIKSPNKNKQKGGFTLIKRGRGLIRKKWLL